jgi:integrase/recombinase XerD
MSDKPISDLRRRMIADMTIRSFSDKTQREYIRQVEAFASFLGRSPDTATGDDIRRFQFAQVEQGAQPPVARSSGPNHNVIAHRPRLPGRSATIKSP